MAVAWQPVASLASLTAAAQPWQAGRQAGRSGQRVRQRQAAPKGAAGGGQPAPAVAARASAAPVRAAAGVRHRPNCQPAGCAPEAKTGSPRCVVPPFLGFTPPTTCVPYWMACRRYHGAVHCGPACSTSTRPIVACGTALLRIMTATQAGPLKMHGPAIPSGASFSCPHHIHTSHRYPHRLPQTPAPRPPAQSGRFRSFL